MTLKVFSRHLPAHCTFTCTHPLSHLLQSPSSPVSSLFSHQPSLKLQHVHRLFSGPSNPKLIRHTYTDTERWGDKEGHGDGIVKKWTAERTSVIEWDVSSHVSGLSQEHKPLLPFTFLQSLITILLWLVLSITGHFKAELTLSAKSHDSLQHFAIIAFKPRGLRDQHDFGENS